MVRPMMIIRSSVTGRAFGAELVGARHPVAGSADGEHERGIGRVALELLPQPAYVHGHRRRVTEVPAPDPAQQLLLAEGLARVAGQEGQQVELPRGQRQRPAGRRWPGGPAESISTGPSVHAG